MQHDLVVDEELRIFRGLVRPSATLRHHDVRYVTCDPNSRYMQPSFTEDVKLIVRGLDAFLPSEAEPADSDRPGAA